MSAKKSIVELTDKERKVCQDVVKKLEGTSQDVKRAPNILLRVERGGTDEESIQSRTSCMKYHEYKDKHPAESPKQLARRSSLSGSYYLACAGLQKAHRES